MHVFELTTLALLSFPIHAISPYIPGFHFTPTPVCLIYISQPTIQHMLIAIQLGKLDECMMYVIHYIFSLILSQLSTHV